MNSWMDDDQDREYPTTEPEADIDAAARSFCVILLVGGLLVLCVLLTLRGLL